MFPAKFEIGTKNGLVRTGPHRVFEPAHYSGRGEEDFCEQSKKGGPQKYSSFSTSIEAFASCPDERDPQRTSVPVHANKGIIVRSMPRREGDV